MQVVVTPTEIMLKDLMEFGQTGVAGHEQSPPHQRAHAAEHDAKLINRKGRYGRFRHAGTLPKPTGFASHLTFRNLPLSKMTRLRVARSAPTPLPVKTISKHMMFSGPKTQPLSTFRYFFHHHLSPVPESTESIPKTRNQNKTTYMKLAHCLIALALALFAVPLLQAQIPIKVVVVTTFENGDDITGNGEFQAWAANLPLPIVIHFPQGGGRVRRPA